MKLCEEIVVKRCYLIYDLSDLIKGIYLHGFSDASRSAYAAYIYLQSVTQWGNVTVKFVAAKSRVIPIKKSFTFPTLELLGNYILSKLICNVYNGIWDDIEVKDILCWSDSQISLAWIKDVNSVIRSLIFWCSYKISSVLSSKEVWKIVFVFPFYEKITDTWKQLLGAVL